MTNEDIIKELTRMRKNFDSNSVYGSYCIDCLDAAIEALKEQQEHSKNTSSKQPDLETLGIKTEKTCEDVISRQAAIDVVRRCSVKEVAPAYMLIDKAEVMTELMMLPSAQPERKNGLWKVIRYNGNMQRYARCKCGYEYGAGKFDGLKFVALKLHNFCPNCGAKMEVEE